MIIYRFGVDYTNFPADYAEVSTFNKAPSECSGTRSPAPYATTTLVNSGNARLIDTKGNSLGSNNGSINQNVYFNGEMYPQANRCVYSESYYDPNEAKATARITENRLGCNTFNPSVGTHGTAFGTIRKNRLKILRNPHFRISFGDNKGINAPNGNHQQHHQQQQQLQQLEQTSCHNEQLYVKIGETNPPTADEFTALNWMQSSSNQSTYQMHQPLQRIAHSNHNVYENRRPNNTDKDVIYAPSGNRSIINCMNSNKHFDNV